MLRRSAGHRILLLHRLLQQHRRLPAAAAPLLDAMQSLGEMRTRLLRKTNGVRLRLVVPRMHHLPLVPPPPPLSTTWRLRGRKQQLVGRAA